MSGLLVIRKAGETFFIGDEIKITVCSCTHGSVKFQVVAPTAMCIVREELVNDDVMRARRREAIDRLKKQLNTASEKLQKIQGDASDIADLGRRPMTEQEAGFIPPGACVIDDAV